MIDFTILLDPVPASRPRVSKWGTYYGKRHKAFQSDAAAHLGTLREDGILPQPPLSGGLSVEVEFKVKRPKSTKLDRPRGDIDNYLKILFDCLTGHLWEDDVLVEDVSATKEWAEEGSIRVVVWEKPDAGRDE